MIISITYIDRNITQVFEVITQELFDEYQYAKSIVPMDKIIHPIWEILSDEEKEHFTLIESKGRWITELHKQNKICTSQSAIFKAYLINDGILRLPINQGSNHPVITKLVEENIFF